MGLTAARPDPVRHCPGCGVELTGGAFVQELWAGDDRHFVCWCAGCSLMCTVVLSPHLVGTEPDH